LAYYWLRSVGEFEAPLQISTGFESWQRYCTARGQPNFAALNTGRHLYSAGRPSRWALAHISSITFISVKFSWGPSRVRPQNQIVVGVRPPGPPGSARTVMEQAHIKVSLTNFDNERGHEPSDQLLFSPTSLTSVYSRVVLLDVRKQRVMELHCGT